LELAGRSVLSWQIEILRALGCERIICLSKGRSDEIVRQHRAVEADGGDFHVVTGNLQLASLMRANDELVMMADGLVPEVEAVKRLALGDERLRKGIWTMPAGHPLAASLPEDFERIDSEGHWAGLAVLRSESAAALADFPPDGDAVSLLLRLGLQDRIERRPIPVSELEAGNWLLAVDESALEKRSKALLKGEARTPFWIAPGSALAARIAHSLPPARAEDWRRLSLAAQALLLLGGTALAATGYETPGLAVVAAGALAGAVEDSLAQMRARIWSHAKGTRSLLGAIATDLFAAAALVFAYAGAHEPVTRITLPLLAIGLVRLASSQGAGASKTFWSDRTIHLAIFAIAAALGGVGPALAIMAFAAMVQLMLRKGRN
jgi:hypothetical protein